MSILFEYADTIDFFCPSLSLWGISSTGHYRKCNDCLQRSIQTVCVLRTSL